MKDDGRHNDGEAGDGVYGVIVKPEEGADQINYYIFAKNAKAVSYDPPRYMYEQYSSSLQELTSGIYK